MVKWLTVVNPLYLIPRIFAIVVFGDMAPYDVHYHHEKRRQMCDSYNDYQLNVAYTEELGDRTEGMNCTEIYEELYTVFTSGTTWQPTEDPEQDVFCQSTVTKDMIFNTLGIDPDLFVNYIVEVIVISVAIRVFAVGILYIGNKEGFSWVRKRLVDCLCCCCSRNEVSDKLECSAHALVNAKDALTVPLLNALNAQHVKF